MFDTSFSLTGSYAGIRVTDWKASMRFVVTGARGMLGSDVVDVLRDREVLALGSNDLDVTNIDSIRLVIQPDDVIINCAAYTKVDDAELNEFDAFQINAIGVKNLAIVAREVGARLITISTDYVFAGDGTAPYLEAENRAPLSAYGRTKAAGEEFALSEYADGTYIVRTAWLYGKNGSNFAQTMLNLAASKDSWSVVDDQLGQPTWTRDLAEQILNLVDSVAPAGIYHGTNSGETTWFGFAQAVLEEAGIDPNRITPTDSSSFLRPAQRPAYSVLSHEGWARTGIGPMRNWRRALHAAFEANVFETPA